MDLLPEDNIGYGTQEYWEGRYYKEREGLEYDWFKKYADLSIYLNKFIKKEDRIVMLGCGNSTLSIDMFNDEFKNIINVDYSPTIIERMSKQHESTSMEWIVADITQLPLESHSVDACIDKGTMDAIMAIEHGDIWNPSDKVKEACRAEVDEALRVLKDGGRFIYITFGQPHFRLPHLRREGCTVETIELGTSFHYYFYVLTKGSSSPVP